MVGDFFYKIEFFVNPYLFSQVTAMALFAFVGSRGIGTLAFSPSSDDQVSTDDEVDLETLGLEIHAIFDGQTEELPTALVAAGSSGGICPKAQPFFSSIAK